MYIYMYVCAFLQPAVTLGQKFSSACRPGVTQFYLGGPGSGSPVHWHNDAVNYAVHGEKTALLEPFIYKMHYFTKTGSGQT